MPKTLKLITFYGASLNDSLTYLLTRLSIIQLNKYESEKSEVAFPNVFSLEMQLDYKLCVYY